MPTRSSRNCALLLLAALAASARAGAVADGELADMSIEQLSSIVITSVSRQEEKLSHAAASIFIISASDIRRSGARSLPEALRLAPNLQVARVDARNYAVTARGFNSPFANKLLMLIDGRSVYTPLFSGVFWDAQDVAMDDVERIEVISGPGATIWGANAVNGVINVITRSARDSQGGLASAVAGPHEKDGTVRYGGSLANGGHYRVYGRYMNQDDTDAESGIDTGTGMRRVQAGFRADWELARGALTVSGDAYDGELGQLGTRDIKISGANLVTRMNRKLAGGGDLRLQLVLDHTERNQPGAFVERLDTMEVEAQHGVQLGDSHNLAWGGGYRYSWDNVTNGPNFGFLPGHLNMHWANLFAQDEITLHPEVRLTAGLKVEHNNYTGAEVLPSLRLAWTPDARQLVWGSVARTVRAPSRIDRDLYLPVAPQMIGGVPRFILAGGPRFESEVARVVELGYRAQPMEGWSYSATAFYSDYDKLRTQEPLPVLGFEALNLGEGNTRGVELWSRWQPAADWRLNAGLVVQSVRIGLKPDSRDTGVAKSLNTNDPNRHWLLRSSHDLSERQQLDLTLRYVSQLPNPVVPAYYELDMQWVWKPRHDVELALIGQNLLHSRHVEFGEPVRRSVYRRSALLTLSYRF